ncbi:MAG: hypothetical protein P8X66_07350 [Maritimibacter sp.]
MRGLTRGKLRVGLDGHGLRIWFCVGFYGRHGWAAGQSFGVSQPDIALCEGDFDPFFGEPPGNFMVHLRAHAELEIHIAQDGADLEIHAVGAKFHEENRRRRVQRHQRMGIGDLFQDRLNLHAIGAIGHAHRHNHPAHEVLPGVVGHHAGNQLGVGQDHIGPVEGFDPGRAHGNIAHKAHFATNFDPVAFADGAFDQQNNPRNEVRDDVLQTKADPDRERTGNDGQRGKVDPSRGDRGDDGKENAQIADTGADRALPASIEFGFRQNRGCQHALGQPRQGKAHGEHHRKGQQIAGRNDRIANGDAFTDPGPDLGEIRHPHPPDQHQNRQQRQ